MCSVGGKIPNCCLHDLEMSVKMIFLWIEAWDGYGFPYKQFQSHVHPKYFQLFSSWDNLETCTCNSCEDSRFLSLASAHISSNCIRLLLFFALYYNVMVESNGCLVVLWRFLGKMLGLALILFWPRISPTIRFDLLVCWKAILLLVFAMILPVWAEGISNKIRKNCLPVVWINGIVIGYFSFIIDLSKE